MKFGTSYFNPTVFRKNMTRFAPAWGLYTLAMVMGLMLILDSSVVNMPRNMMECIQMMSVITPCYALLTVQLLFGDLYSARMCNALHAMPIRREGWFFTNVAAGLAFHLIPTVVMGTLATAVMAMSSYPGGWVTGPLWVLCVNLQYICFFGIGVFSAFCVGNRFAMAVVYGLLNFGALIAGWLANTLFEPLLYGVKISAEPFYWFSPVGYLVANSVGDVSLVREYVYGVTSHVTGGELVLEEGWPYLWLVAGVGLVLTGLGLVLYRRRRLECAGDFMAVKNLEPVFLVIYTVCVGAVFQFVMDDMFSVSSGPVFLFVGLVVGYFTGQMLLQRTVRVFQLREILRCGGIILAMAAVLVLVAMDVFGVVSWVPEASQVKQVLVQDGFYTYHECEITLSEPEDVEKVIAMHREALARADSEMGNGGVIELVQTAESVPYYEDREYTFFVPVTITYQMNDGRKVARYYYIYSTDPGIEDLREFFSRMVCVFGEDIDLAGLKNRYNTAYVTMFHDNYEEFSFTGADVEELLEAMVLDCEAGTMVRAWEFHSNEIHVGDLHLNGQVGLEVNVHSGNANVLQWMREHGFEVDALLAEMEQK